MVALGVAASARAEDIIFPGVQPKLAAGAGQTVSRGSDALFYNPANIIFSKFIEPYADVSFAKIDYVYQHTDTDTFNPAVVSVMTPAITAGIAMRPFKDFAFGVAFYPTGAGAEQKILDVPTPVAGTYTPLDIVQKQSGYKLALGGAYRFGFPFTAGVGLIRTTETNSIVALKGTSTLADGEDPDSRDPVADARYGGAFNQFIVGGRSELFDRQIALGVSYKTAVEKTYAGDVLINTGSPNDDYQPFTGVGYLPAAIGFGAEGRIGPFGAFIDFVHEIWTPAASIAKRGLGADPDAVAFVDTNNICVGVKFWLFPEHMLTAAFGMHGANVGDGTITDTAGSGLTGKKRGAGLTDDTTTADPVVGGVTFGALEAIPRTVFSGGYRMKLSGTGYLDVGAFYATGTRIVPEGASGEGTYSLTEIMGTIGLAFGF